MTYHSEWPEAPACHALLRAWLKRLQRRFRGCLKGWLWRKELQRRGAPHYHVMLWFGVELGRGEVEWAVMQAWHDCCVAAGFVAAGDEAHYVHGCNVRPVRSRGVVAYLSKYLAKLEDAGGASIGRIWGYGGNLPDVALGLNLSRDALVELCRRLRRWGKGSRYVSRLNERRGWLVYGGWSLAALMREIEGVRWDVEGIALG